jgi:hypothetical protein
MSSNAVFEFRIAPSFPPYAAAARETRGPSCTRSAGERSPAQRLSRHIKELSRSHAG